MPPSLLPQYPCRLQDWEDDWPNDRGGEPGIAYSPAEQDRATLAGGYGWRLCRADFLTGAGEQRNWRAPARNPEDAENTGG